MSKLRMASKLLIPRHHCSNMIRMLNRAIDNEIITPIKPVHIAAAKLLSEAEVVKDTNNSVEGNDKNDVNKSKKSDGTNAKVPKPTTKNNTLPPVTIVDVNSGYGRMDFEERMEHMDRVEGIEDAKVSSDIASKLVLPYAREMPQVVDINGYGDDMMYEDEPEVELQPASGVKPNEKTADKSDIAENRIPIANDEQRKPQPPATLRQETQQATIGEIEAFTNAIRSKKTEFATLNAKTEVTNNKPATSEVQEICVAPVDIDAFGNEDERKQGTVDIDAFGDDERMQLPPIPKVRNNVFEFKGITIIMPRRMLRDATYRYRLDPNDKDKPDDIQICMFEK